MSLYSDDDDDGRIIEQADGVRLGMCEFCNHPHLFLLDMNGDPFAEVVLDVESATGLIAGLQEVLRELHIGTVS